MLNHSRWKMSVRALFLVLVALTLVVPSVQAGVEAEAVPYLTLSPERIVTAPGTRVSIFSAIHSHKAAEDSLIFFSDAGRVEVVSQPRPPFLEGRAFFYAPTEPGIYTVGAFSKEYQQYYDEVEVVVTGAHRFVLRSDPSLIFDRAGGKSRIRVAELFVGGDVDDKPSVNYRSSNPSVATVHADGTVVAGSTGSATITIGRGRIEPARVTVTVADLRSNARLLTAEQVRYVWSGHALLDGSIPRPQVGQMLVAGTRGGLFGRVTYAGKAGPHHWVTFGGGALPDAFRTLKVVHQRLPLQTPSEEGKGEQAKASSFECSHSIPGNNIVLDPGTLAPGVDNLYLNWTYDLVEGQAPVMAIWLSGDFTVTASGAFLSLDLQAGITLDCRQSFGPKAFGSFPVGPIFVGGTLTPIVGMELEAQAVGSLRFNAPTLQYRMAGLKQGFGYDGTGFFGISDHSPGTLSVFYPEGVAPVDTSVALSAELRPYAGALLGLGITAGGVDGYAFDMLDLKGFGYAKAGIEDPLNPNDSAYGGPSWEVGLGAYVGVDSLIGNPVLREALQQLGLVEALDIDPKLYDWRSEPFVTSTQVSISADKDESVTPHEAVFKVSTTAPAQGAPTEILSWPEDNPDGAPTQMGTLHLGAEGKGELRTPWSSTEILVSARVYDGNFGDIGLPYAPGTVKSGGSHVPDCDGPECPPTSPGGSGGPGGSTGGGFGDPGDTGDPGYPGTVGGGVGAPGSGDGGVQSGSGNLDLTAGSTGDPHIISLDGLRFNFQGAGEYVLAGLSAGTQYLGGGDLEVQVRQKQIHPGLQGAINTAVGVRLGAHRVEIYADPQPGDAHLYVDGSAAAGSVDLGDGGVFVQGSRYTLVWPDGSRVRVNRGDRHLDLMVALSEARSGHVMGLLGYLDQDRANDFITRDGGVQAPPINFHQLYDLVGDSWRVPAQEKLIDPSLGGGDPTDLDFPESFPAADIPQDVLDEAENRCSQAGIYIRGVLEACRYDVALLLNVDPPDEPLVASIIEGHLTSQGDLFGEGDGAELYFVSSVAFMNPLATADFAASVHGSANSDVSWIVSGGSVVSSTGTAMVWEAPAQLGTYQITARSDADPSLSQTIEVVVDGDQGAMGFTADSWSLVCENPNTVCQGTFVDDHQSHSGDGRSVRFTGRFGYGGGFSTPVNRDLSAGVDRLVSDLRVPNPSAGWQRVAHLRLVAQGGSILFTPDVRPVVFNQWTTVTVPLDGGTLNDVTWTVTETGTPDWSQVLSLEWVFDPWQNPSLSIRFDRLFFE